MRVLRLGMHGDDVMLWQHFLVGFAPKALNAPAPTCDGDFGAETLALTRRFQTVVGLGPDGCVGNDTLQAALAAGFCLVPDHTDLQTPPPSFGPMPLDVCEKTFGTFDYTPHADGSISIDPHWVDTHIVAIAVPWRDGSKKTLRVHQRAAAQFAQLFADWASAGLLSRIETDDGTFVPRKKRGRDSLSRHSWGVAIDLNAFANPQGCVPASVHTVGCVRELVAAANARGFYWGGHFHHVDPMHFEVAVPLPVRTGS